MTLTAFCGTGLIPLHTYRVHTARHRFLWDRSHLAPHLPCPYSTSPLFVGQVSSRSTPTVSIQHVTAFRGTGLIPLHTYRVHTARHRFGGGVPGAMSDTTAQVLIRFRTTNPCSPPPPPPTDVTRKSVTFVLVSDVTSGVFMFTSFKSLQCQKGRCKHN